MGSCQDDPINEQSFEQMVYNYRVSSTLISSIFILVALTGLYIVFIRYRNYKKPFFVKIIWIMVTISFVAAFIFIVIWNKDLKSYFINQITDGGESSFDLAFCRQMIIVQELMTQLMHWQFAGEYFSASKRFFLVVTMNPGDERLLACQKRAKVTIYAINIFFYLSVATWLIL